MSKPSKTRTDETENGGAKVTRGVRFSDEQIEGLRARAGQIKRQTGVNVKWTTLVGVAVDEFLEAKRQKLAA